MPSRIEWAHNVLTPLQMQYLRTCLLMGMNHWSRQYEYPWVMEHGDFRHNQLVLDAGGSNRCCLLQYLLADLGCHVVNLDIDPTQFDIKDPRVLYFQADMRKMPFLDNSFSKVMCVSVLEHVDNPEKALAELWRVLAPGGRLVITMDIVSRRSHNSISNLHHVIEESDAIRLLQPFGLHLPPQPEGILTYELEGTSPPVIVRVVCLYVDK